MNHSISRLLLALACTVAACGGGADPAASSSVGSTSVSTTSAVASSTSSSPAVATDGDLAEYLAGAYLIAADLVEDQAILTASGGGPEQLAEVWSEARIRFERLEAPPEAAAHRDGWLAMTGAFGSALETFMSVDFNEEGAGERALAEFLGAIAAQASTITELDAEQADLARLVFDSRDDETSRYLSGMLTVQADAAPMVTRLFELLGELGDDPERAVSEMIGVSVEIAALGSRWDAELDPPVGLVDLHDRQVALLTDMGEVYAGIGAALDADREPDADIVIRIQILSVEAQQLNTEWSRSIAAALSG